MTLTIDPDPSAPAPGLSTTAPGQHQRDRRRQKVEAGIQEAALELFSKHGFDAVTTNEVARAAGVSRRTLFRYFPSKEELVLRDMRRRVELFIDALAARPRDEPLLAAIRSAVMTAAESYEEDRDAIMRIEAIIAGAPGVLARAAGEPTALLATITGLVAERLGADPVRDLLPTVIATTVVSASHAALGLWMATPGSSYTALATNALDLIEQGLRAAVEAFPRGS